jgi:hypothetical protein
MKLALSKLSLITIVDKASPYFAHPAIQTTHVRSTKTSATTGVPLKILTMFAAFEEQKLKWKIPRYEDKEWKIFWSFLRGLSYCLNRTH